MDEPLLAKSGESDLKRMSGTMPSASEFGQPGTPGCGSARVMNEESRNGSLSADDGEVQLANGAPSSQRQSQENESEYEQVQPASGLSEEHAPPKQNGLPEAEIGNLNGPERASDNYGDDDDDNNDKAANSIDTAMGALPKGRGRSAVKVPTAKRRLREARKADSEA